MLWIRFIRESFEGSEGMLGKCPEALNGVRVDDPLIYKRIVVIHDMVTISLFFEVVVRSVTVTVDGRSFYNIFLDEWNELSSTRPRNNFCNDKPTFPLT